jgi:ATP-binding cassette subfamily F protein uup
MDKVVDHIFAFNGGGDIKDFPGNYTEYRDWREEEKAAAKPVEKSAQPKSAYRSESKRKLTFKERKEYESLEPEILALEEEKSLLEQEMSSGTLDNATLLEHSMRIQEVIALIDEKTERWVELSEFA